jgi:uncharacterized protein YdhG (YjbR/CyaY superfamily)
MAVAKFKTVDEYIASFPPDVRKALKQVRQAILDAAPEAEEKIAYGMAAYRFHGTLTYFGGWAKHVGLYALPFDAFAKELARYETSKGTVQFPFDRPIPVALIRRMVKHQAKANLAKAKAKGR